MKTILSGRPINAKTALTISLLKDITTPPISYTPVRNAVLGSTGTDPLIGIDYEKKLYSIVIATDDSHEDLAAYNEKRLPTYKGK